MYLPCALAISMPSRCRCLSCSRSNCERAANTVNMNLPVGVSVSIFSLWLMRVTPLSVSVSMMFSKSFVERPRRLMLTLEIVNWYGAVIAQSGRQFDENVLYLSTVKFEKVGLIFRKNFALFSKFCLLHRNICVDLCEM